MRIFTILLLFFIAGCSAKTITAKQGAKSFILQNVNIIDVEKQSIQTSKSLVVIDGKIQSVTDKTASSGVKDLPIIDGRGGYITPGLIDMHVHMYEKAAYVLALSHGVTHVRIMNGVPEQLKWRDNIRSGLQLGSTSTVSSPIISGYKDAYLHHGLDTAKEARAAIHKYKNQGYDLIKAYGNLSQQALSALVDEAKKLNMPVAKHGPHASGDMPVSRLAGFQSFEHVEDIYQGPLNYQFAPQALAEVAQELKATAVPITPTLNIFDQLTRLSRDKQEYLAQSHKEYTSDIIALEANQNQVKRWLNASDKMVAHNQQTLNFLLQITGYLHEQGIPLLVGSDSGVLLSPHGLATHNEMQLLQQAGLNNYEVLAAATINPAKALKLDKRMGKIAKGYTADFIYSTVNPIDDLTVLKQPEAVSKQGLWYSKQELIKARKKAIDSRSFWEEFRVLIEGI